MHRLTHMPLPFTQPRHGIDMLGRDALLLGQLLTTLAAFAAAVYPAPPAPLITGALLELVADPRVAAHQQPGVRRAALGAAAQALRALPPAWLAGAVAGGQGGGARLVELLAWLRRWTGAKTLTVRRRVHTVCKVIQPTWHTATVFESDPDDTCRQLAGACGALQAQLAAAASHVLSSAPPGPADLQGGVAAAARGLSALALPGGGVLKAT